MIQLETGVLVWVHGDCLNPAGPALQAYPAAPAVFVFDTALLQEYQLSAKRLLFIYECLLEIPCLQIRKGDVADELALAACSFGCDRIATVTSVAPRFKQICEELRQEKHLSVEGLDLPLFVDLGEEEETRLDLRRFSRYWQVASRHVF